MITKEKIKIDVVRIDFSQNDNPFSLFFSLSKDTI